MVRKPITEKLPSLHERRAELLSRCVNPHAPGGLLQYAEHVLNMVFRDIQEVKLARQRIEDSAVLRKLVGYNPLCDNQLTNSYYLHVGRLNKRKLRFLPVIFFLLDDEEFLRFSLVEILTERVPRFTDLNKESCWFDHRKPLLELAYVALWREFIQDKGKPRSFGGRWKEIRNELKDISVRPTTARKPRKLKRKDGYTDKGSLAPRDVKIRRALEEHQGYYESQLNQLINEAKNILFQEGVENATGLELEQIVSEWDRIRKSIKKVLNQHPELLNLVPRDLVTHVLD